MGDRRQARELALQALFFFDMDKSDPDESPDEKIEAFCANNEEKLTQGVKPFCMDLIKGVIDHQGQIDTLLNTYSKNWKLSRMPVVTWFVP